MKKRMLVPVLLGMVLACGLGQDAMAQDGWKFGIGTGFSTLDLYGDMAFASSAGPLYFDVDLSNSDTSDLRDSAFGFGGFAAKGKWSILYKLGTMKLTDEESGINAEWKKSQIEVLAGYSFLKTDKNSLAVLFGARYIDHDWDIEAATGGIPSTVSVDIDEGWTDGVVGLNHSWAFAEKWSWNSRADAAFGGSEGSYTVTTGASWQAFEHWSFYGNIYLNSFDYGEDSDSGKSDFYRYDVEETGLSLGFLYTF